MNNPYRLISGLTFFCILCAGINALSAPGIYESETERKLDEYHSAVSLMNLLNGLHLTEEQQKKLLALNYKISKTKKAEVSDSKYTELRLAAESSMKELQEYLLKHPEEENNNIQEKAADAYRNFRDYTIQRGEKLKAEFDKIQNEASQILTDEQKEIIENFKPCIIPPKDLRDPVRAGQAKQNSPVLNGMNKIRQIKNNKELFEAALNTGADRIINYTTKRVYKMTDAEKAAKKTEVIKLLREASALSDTDYELRKNEIAAKIAPEDKMEQLRSEFEKRNPHRNPAKGIKSNRLAKFLLDSEIVIPVLEKRLQASPSGGLR
ncbi:MAG: hypothetical protein A2017_19810 [Lentisphaerae bacterium GWF2_44_16]|nr:MAG: hypothetical protein A2017_19810 [Lentisphaerae bacterium GWF2_44_16]